MCSPTSIDSQHRHSLLTCFTQLRPVMLPPRSRETEMMHQSTTFLMRSCSSAMMPLVRCCCIAIHVGTPGRQIIFSDLPSGGGGLFHLQYRRNWCGSRRHSIEHVSGLMPAPGAGPAKTCGDKQDWTADKISGTRIPPSLDFVGSMKTFNTSVDIPGCTAMVGSPVSWPSWHHNETLLSIA